MIDKEKTIDGVSISGIENVMLDILSYTDSVNKILNNISTIVDDTKTCFKCEAGDSFREQYASISIDISTVNKNFLSYNSDFMRVLNNYRLRDDSGLDIISTKQKYADYNEVEGKENL